MKEERERNWGMKRIGGEKTLKGRGDRGYGNIGNARVKKERKFKRK